MPAIACVAGVPEIVGADAVGAATTVEPLL
jgi:hypothetical protein